MRFAGKICGFDIFVLAPGGKRLLRIHWKPKCPPPVTFGDVTVHEVSAADLANGFNISQICGCLTGTSSLPYSGSTHAWCQPCRSSMQGSGHCNVPVQGRNRNLMQGTGHCDKLPRRGTIQPMNQPFILCREKKSTLNQVTRASIEVHQPLCFSEVGSSIWELKTSPNS